MKDTKRTKINNRYIELIARYSEGRLDIEEVELFKKIQKPILRRKDSEAIHKIYSRLGLPQRSFLGHTEYENIIDIINLTRVIPKHEVLDKIYSNLLFYGHHTFYIEKLSTLTKHKPHFLDLEDEVNRLYATLMTDLTEKADCNDIIENSVQSSYIKSDYFEPFEGVSDCTGINPSKDIQERLLKIASEKFYLEGFKLFCKWNDTFPAHHLKYVENVYDQLYYPLIGKWKEENSYLGPKELSQVTTFNTSRVEKLWLRTLSKNNLYPTKRFAQELYDLLIRFYRFEENILELKELSKIPPDFSAINMQEIFDDLLIKRRFLEIKKMEKLIKQRAAFSNSTIEHAYQILFHVSLLDYNHEKGEFFDPQTNTNVTAFKYGRDGYAKHEEYWSKGWGEVELVREHLEEDLKKLEELLKKKPSESLTQTFYTKWLKWQLRLGDKYRGDTFHYRTCQNILSTIRSFSGIELNSKNKELLSEVTTLEEYLEICPELVESTDLQERYFYLFVQHSLGDAQSIYKKLLHISKKNMTPDTLQRIYRAFVKEKDYSGIKKLHSETKIKPSNL